MKLALLKTCFLIFCHLIAKRDTFTDAATLFTNKQYKASLELCNSQIKKLDTRDSLYERFLFLRSQDYFELQEFESGIKDCEHLIKIKPEMIPYYVNLSYMYSEIKNYDKCLGILHDALKISPKDVVVLSNLSYFSGQINKFDEAIGYSNEGLKYQPDSTMKSALLNNRGFAYMNQKKYTEALRDINEAINLDPTNFYAWCYRARVNIKIKKFGTVCDDLAKARELGGVKMTEALIKQYCTVQKI